MKGCSYTDFFCRIRQVKDVDFGFVLPGQDNGALKPRLSGRARSTPRAEYLAPQRSSRRTPAAEPPPPKSSRRTPASQRRAQSQAAPTPATELFPQRSTGRSASASISRKRARSTSHDVTQNGLTDHVPERSTKKLRRDEQPEKVPEEGSTPNGTVAAITGEQNEDLPPASSGKKRKKRKSIGQQAMRKSRPVGQPPQRPLDLDTPKRRGRPKALNPQPPDTEDLENTIQDQLRRENADLDGGTTAELDEVVLQSVEPAVNTGNTPLKFKRKKRISAGQQSGRKARHGLPTVKEETAEGDATMDEIPPTETDLAADEDEESQDDLDEEPIAKPAKSRQGKPKRKKRKSIGQQRPKRPPVSSPGIQTSRSDQRKRVKRPPRPAQKGHTKPFKPPPRREASELHTTQASASASDHPPPAPGKKARGRPALTSATKPAPAPSPIEKHPPKKKNKKKQAPADTIPITVYRPPTHTSPPSPSSADHITSAAASAAPASVAPKTFNPADVLAQITLERLTKIASKLPAAHASRTQRKALALFTQELEGRMRQLSGAWDTNRALQVRAREMGKREKGLRKEIKAVESEREEVKTGRAVLEREVKRGKLEAALRRIAAIARKGWEEEEEKEEGRRCGDDGQE